MKTQVKETVTINEDQGLFVIPCGGGVTCLGFDVCLKWSTDLAIELGLTVPMERYKNTLGAYEYYQELLTVARERHQRTGWRSTSQLTKQLVGLEGCRIEVVDCYGETRRFIVGKSTGFIPCHLEVANRRSSGGTAVTGTPYKSVRVIRGKQA